jgi:ketosteroid isomerase-like protein
MKPFLLIALTLSVVSGYARQDPSSTNPQVGENVKKELTEAVSVISQSLEKMDAEALFQSYSDSPDFILFTTDGSMLNYAGAKNHHVMWFKSLSSLNVTTLKQEFRTLPGNAVVCAWCSRFAMTLKSGGQPTVDFAVTFIFNKIDGHWKVIYQQTSALPPAQDKPGK